MNISIFLPTQQPKSKPSKPSANIHVMPGQVITTETGYLRGHGTYEQDGKLFASVSGVVERVNKLISVKPLKARFHGEIGDVIVGRITEVSQKLWKVDVNGKMDALLLLSAVNLPGGVLRRRTTSDELQMRSLYVENDIISAEVQEVRADGMLALHTRSLKYGKLINGQLVKVQSVLIKRVKNHFHSFPFGIDIILGMNGNVWISQAESELYPNLQEDEQKPIVVIQPEVREKIARVRNAIVALNTVFVEISPDTISDVYDTSLQSEVDVKDMLKPDIVLEITKHAKDR